MQSFDFYFSFNFMVRWELLTDETACRIWDNNLTRFPDFSPFQMHCWGAYNRTLGWEPCYFAARGESGEIVALMLGLLRRYPLGIGILWCVGGPVGDVTTWDGDLQKALTKATGLKHLYCRFRCDRERRTGDALALNHQSWMRSWFMLHSSWTMELDLGQEEAELLAKCSRNWRRNFQASKKNNLQISLWENPNIDEVVAIYADLQARKNLPEQFSRKELTNLFECAASNFVCYRALDETGEPVALRGCLIIGDRAIDYLAATTEQGRNLRASYTVFWRLLQDCRERGVKFYDLSGIDPYENPGVYNFKRETGARHVESLGEWDWATSGWLRWFGNWTIWQRNRLKS